MGKFYYGMRLRGYSPWCQPDGVIDRKDDFTGRYHDIIVYDRKLTDREVLDFSLDFLGEEED